MEDITGMQAVRSAQDILRAIDSAPKKQVLSSEIYSAMSDRYSLRQYQKFIDQLVKADYISNASGMLTTTSAGRSFSTRIFTI